MAVVNNSLQLNDRMTPVLRSITRALDATLTAMASVDRVAQREFQAAARATNQARQAVEQFRNSVASTGSQSQQSFNNVANGANNANNAVSGLVDKVKMLAGAYLGMQGVAKLVSGGDTYTGNAARLNLLVKEGEAVDDLQTKIYEASQRSLTNYGDMTNAVAQLGITAAHSFTGNDEIIAFTEQLNKQFKIAGTSAQSQSAAMYQLTQAMASGRLQGDEFRSIMENAPLLAATVAKHMNLTFGQLREASSEGKITANVIKSALLNPEAVAQAEEMFKNMPMTFGDLMTQATNKINRGLEPLYVRLGQMWNNPDMQDFITSMVNGFVWVANAGISAFNTLAAVAGVIHRNWSFIEPILWGVSTVLGTIIIPKLWAMVPPIWSAATAWLAMNWPILLVGVLIASLVGIIMSFGVTTEQIIGFITGAIMGAVALIWNVVYTVISLILLRLDDMVNPILGVVEWIYNAFNGGFNGIGGAAVNLIGNLISWFLQLGKTVTTIIDAMFGTNWTDGLNSLQDKVRSWGKNDKALTVEQNVATNKAKELGLGRMEYGKSIKGGFEWGSGKTGAVKDAFKVGDKTFNTMPLNYDMSKIAGNTGATADNTKKLTEGINLNEEDIELLKETARISFVNRFTTMTPNITATFGDVHETADVKGIMGQIEKSVMDALESSLT